MSIYKADPKGAAAADFVKLHVIQGLLTVALKTGQTFAQFADAAATAGVTIPADAGRDCTDLRKDAEMLGIETHASEQQAYAQLAVAAEALAKCAATLEERRAQKKAAEEPIMRLLLEELGELAGLPAHWRRPPPVNEAV